MSLDCKQLERIFAEQFFQSHHTQLCGGYAEPYYQPAQAEQPAQIQYRLDYFASALHELAHWCLAGAKRRSRADYGYWYHPEGRDLVQQQQFETFESRPQALEWLLSVAAGSSFRPSADNLALPDHDLRDFSYAIQQQAKLMLAKGIPPRGAQLIAAINRQNPSSQWSRVQAVVTAGAITID